MRIVLFCHSLVSDWNHGNAHFLRGIARELGRAGHEVEAFEPADGWSRRNLIADAGPAAVAEFEELFPDLRSTSYGVGGPDLDEALAGADLVIVHDWNDPALVSAVGAHRRRGGSYLLFFYDAHHRAATAPEQIDRFDLDGYDAVLAFGAVIRDIYLQRGWISRAFVWHEAADTSMFRPLRREAEPEADLVWIGNWGDGERTAELHEFLLEPAAALGLSGHVHGVRYPREAVAAVRAAGLHYEGWLPNHRAPLEFARHAFTVHVPRRAYARRLPGIPTIRMFEALACGIPLVSAPWEDSEGLFRPGQDFLVARDGAEMRRHLRELRDDPARGAALAASGLERVRERHTCAHRVRELLAIAAELTGAKARV